jgi:hypothetical protein
VTTSVDYSLAQLIQVIILLSTGGNNGGGYMASKYVVIAFHAAILLSHAIINSLPISWLSFYGQFAAAWNMLGDTSLSGARDRSLNLQDHFGQILIVARE